MSLKDDIKDVPSWVWLGGAAAAGVLLFLHARTAASGSSAASVPLTSGSGQVSGVQSGLAPDGTLPSQYNPPAPAATPAAAPAGVTFSQALATILPSLYSQSGFANNPTDAGFGQPGQTDLFNTLGQFGSDNAQYQDWLARTQAASQSGNVAGFHQLLQQGEQYGAVFGTQQVTPQGWLATIPAVKSNSTNAQLAQSLPATGGGGFAYHPNAVQTGGMSDAFGLQSPTNPSIHG